jgi:Zn-dependent M32 family carboxypeptidase
MSKAAEMYGIAHQEKYDAIWLMHEDGISTSQIARYFNVTTESIRQILEARGYAEGRKL